MALGTHREGKGAVTAAERGGAAVNNKQGGVWKCKEFCVDH